MTSEMRIDFCAWASDVRRVKEPQSKNTTVVVRM